MSNNQCAACGQWSGRGHKCPPALVNPNLTMTRDTPQVATSVIRPDVNDRVNRAQDYLDYYDDNRAEMDLANREAEFDRQAEALAAERGISFEAAAHMLWNGEPQPPTPPKAKKTREPKPLVVTQNVPPTFAESFDDEDALIRAWESTGMTTSDAQAAVDAQRHLAKKHENASAAHYQEKADSWERSDTDGFVSQWASGVMGRKESLEQAVAEHGGTWTFAALMKDGELVPAKIVPTKYGDKWAVFNTFEEANSKRGKVVEWVAPKESSLKSRGYEEADQIRPAKVGIRGNHAVNVHAYTIPNDGMDVNPLAPVIRRPPD